MTKAGGRLAASRRATFAAAKRRRINGMAEIALRQGRAQAGARCTTAWNRLKANRNWLGALVHAAGSGVPDLCSRLSARPRRLAVLHRRQASAVAACSLALRTMNGCGTISVSGCRCSTRCSTRASPASLNSPSASISRCCSTRDLPFKAILRALVLIPFIVPTVLSAIAFWWIFDQPVLDRFLVAAKTRPDRCQY